MSARRGSCSLPCSGGRCRARARGPYPPGSPPEAQQEALGYSLLSTAWQMMDLRKWIHRGRAWSQCPEPENLSPNSAAFTASGSEH
jgi:hypothetical protein